MRAVVQRVTRASVTVDGEVVGEIGRGLLILLGVAKGDNEAGAEYLLNKIWNLRIFEDEAGKMNVSALEIGAEVLVVSQFTLYGDVSRGRRPGFDMAAPPDEARRLYEFFVEKARTYPLRVETGQFRAHMFVELVNDGPVTLLVDSPTA